MTSESSKFPQTTNETGVRAFRAASNGASFGDASAEERAANGGESSNFPESTNAVAADAQADSSSISVVLPIIKSDSVGERGSASGRTIPRRDGRASIDDETTTAAAPEGSGARGWGARPFEGDRTVVSNEPPMDCGRGSASSDDENGPDGGANDLKNGGALPPGTRFGHFVVSKYIGGGGMGRVYEGVDAALDRKVAIKVLPRQRAQDQGTVARFLNEAKSAARLNHEHIAQVYFCGEENGVPYIAFEYVSGTNLRDYVRERGVLELGEAIDYVLQAAGALAHAAAHGVTHRDVKPSNIIVTPQKNAKLIDMGLARLLKADVADDLTESGVTLGTFDYISPEQARDPRVADVRSDIYSLGCTFYYMLVGTPPFPDGTVLQKLLQHQGDEAPDVREANPTVPVEVAAVLKKMMKKNPDERYQTPDALIADLFEIAEMIGLRLSERNVASADAQEKKAPTATLRRLPGVCAIVFFLGVVAVFYWSTRGAEVRLPVVDVAPPTALVGGGARGPGETASIESAPTAVEPTSQAAQSAQFAESSAAVSGVSSTGPVGEILDAAALDSLYASRAAEFERAPVLSVDDGREWRRVYLSGSASVASSRRVAAGWRARSLVDANVGFDAIFARGARNGASPAVAATARAAFAYSFLGVSADVAPQDVPATNATRTVDRVGVAPQTFASLQSALSGARDGSAPLRVELKFNGTLETPPISLAGAKVEIAAAEGFRPTLLFKPPETPNGGWGERMFLLSDCDLTLDGVSVDFTVPSQEVVASEWSVFETLGATSLTIRNATLTVCNSTGETFAAPLHSNVALFRSTSRSALGESTAAPTAVANESAAAPIVRLKNVFARCEATVWTSDRLDGEFYAEFSGFNASGPIVQIGEAESGATETAGVRSERSRFLLNFDRVVAIGRSSLARFEEGAASAASIPLDVSLTNSIVRLDSAPLSVVSSSRPLEDGAAPGSDWKLDGSLLLDVSSFCRTRLRRTSQFSDAPVPKALAFDAKTLSELNADAPVRLAETAPHLFAISDFSRWILNPARTSTAVGDLLRANAEEIKANFVDVAAE